MMPLSDFAARPISFGARLISAKVPEVDRSASLVSQNLTHDGHVATQVQRQEVDIHRSLPSIYPPASE